MSSISSIVVFLSLLPAQAPKERFKVPDGFIVENLVPRTARYPGLPAGKHVSFVNMCFDARGWLLLSQEQGPILICKKTDENKLHSELDVYCDQVKNCQGMCWVKGALLLVGNGPKGTGLYRCVDSDGDDKVDDVQLLHKFKGGMGEHGPHAIVHGPDDRLYLVIGNHAWAQIGDAAAKDGNPQKLAANSPLTRWPTGSPGPDQDKLESTEDVLLPRLNDANGHAANILAPGGTIWRLDHKGGDMSLVSAGYRNQYDAAFNSFGEMFSFDSDMEWDVGLPWYRHVRVVHAPQGSDFGWRTGAANQPGYLFDFLPPLVDTGRGSPVGVEVYDDVAFPEKYRGAVLCADWAVGTIYSIHLQPNGASYKAVSEKFITGAPMNVTDLAVGADGALYFSLGGRNGQGEVYRVRHRDPGPVMSKDPLEYVLTAPQPWASYRRADLEKRVREGKAELAMQLQAAARDKAKPVSQRTRALDLLHLYTNSGVPTELLVDLAKDDAPLVRAHAIWLLGLQAPAEARDVLIAALRDRDAFVKRRACEALIRAGVEPPIDEIWLLLGDRDRFLRCAARNVLERIDPKKWTDKLWEETQVFPGLDGIVALCRTNKAELYAGKIFDWLGDVQPPDIDLDFLDLVRTWQLVLCHTESRPQKLLRIVRPWPDAFPHGDKNVNRELAILLAGLRREKLILDPVNAALLFREGSDEDLIHNLYCLRGLPDAWTMPEKELLLKRIGYFSTKSGGNSYAGFLQNVFKDLLSKLPVEDRRELVLAAAENPWAAAMVLPTLPAKEFPPPAKLSELFKKLDPSKKRTKDLRDHILASLGQDAAAEDFLRKIADDDPTQDEAVARNLAKSPSKANWPYLVRGLEAKSPVALVDIVKALTKIEQAPRISNPAQPGEAKPYRSLILAAGRMGEKERWQAVLLLRHWAKRTFGLEDDAKKELEGWSRWYGQTFPGQPSLPNVAELTATTKWNSAELLAFLDNDPRGKTGDLARGRTLFEKASCIKCHKFGKEGEGIGPDLTAVKGRFKKADLIESILFPSKVISDQYRATTFVTKGGKVITGLAALQGDAFTVLQIDGTKVAVTKSDIEQQVSSTLSAMPEKLLEELTREDIADLIAYLLSDPPK